MQFVKQSRINASPARVFDFHESPGALERLTPPWEKVTLESGGTSIKPGARVVLVTKLGPIPLRWVAEHVDYSPPHLFSDHQVSGPFARWFHRHEFLDDGQGGTILRDVVDFEPPLGALGRIFGTGFVRSKLNKMFDYRHEMTRKIVESGDFEPAETID
jgi:ligand-binding SRPBCC domain-containing protein